jgi:hypothetical protein
VVVVVVVVGVVVVVVVVAELSRSEKYLRSSPRHRRGASNSISYMPLSLRLLRNAYTQGTTGRSSRGDIIETDTAH